MLQAKYEAFDTALGEHAGAASGDVWRYVVEEAVPAGRVLCRAGEVHGALHVLQQGRLTAYRPPPARAPAGSPPVRVRTMTRGAYVNELSLLGAAPARHSVVADKDSIVLSPVAVPRNT